jgi:hypothetical protein
MKRTPLKQISVSKAKKRAWTAFSIYKRTKGCLETTGTTERGKCFTCDREKEFKGLQAGHFVGGRHNGNLFSDKGVQIQCPYCNIILKGNVLEYRRRLIAKYGPDIDTRLEIEAAQVVQYKVFELLEMEARFKQMTKELLEKHKEVA